MEKFTRLTATACPLEIPNLNTDQIIPVRFLKLPRSAGYGKFLLHDLRRDAEGRERPEFSLNQPAWSEARILVGGRNFACGSSREAAVYALVDRGIRCVIAPSFGDIFAGNAVQNGLLAAMVQDEQAAALAAALRNRPSLPVAVDLEQQTIVCGPDSFHFSIDPVRRLRLLNGWEDIDLTRSHADEIASFRAMDHTRRPWATPHAAPAPDAASW
ncbi:MAG TPA: 3-isopropylmalate dehydratase small subunit [Xanthobacteraceae bacterium]|jgi:3-isopropylmalate/(R)-2-methylmalate dehydratase small subunit